ncbi:hypothetical protein LC040_08530 [Bacillus tianshenii]|nr:hypothetical protein LC040_08530 [Bacillus tianshenii]
MKGLDIKQKVLLAYYTEYQKDLPDMESITAEKLELSNDVFIVALQKLVNEGLITNVEFVVGGREKLPVMVNTKLLMVSPRGLSYVESKLNINPTDTGEEKTSTVVKRLTEWGYNELKDITVKVAAELIKG